MHPVDDMPFELEAVVLLLAAVGAVAVCSYVGWLEWRHRHSQPTHDEPHQAAPASPSTATRPPP